MKKSIKAIPNSFRNLVIAILATSLVFAFFGCKPEPETTDTTAPAEVTSLNSTAQNSAVLLTWTDPSDEDLFGIEITYTAGNSSSSRVAISAMESKSVFIAPGTQAAVISNLTNGSEYTFTVKAMDTSGNKSGGVKTEPVKPVAVDASEPLKIALSASVPKENGYTGNKSNTSVTVTANITTSSNVSKVVCKKDGSRVAQDLLADEDVEKATVDKNDNKKWTVTIRAEDETANGTYTVAAIDEAGREETEQITIDNFDFTAPERVKVTGGGYSSSSITLIWTDPSDQDFDHVKITYTSNDGAGDSEKSKPIEVKKGTQIKTFTDIDASKAYYTYYLVSVDAVGNESKEREYKVSVSKSVSNVPEGFVEVKGTTFDGTKTLTPSSSVFISGRSITIGDLYVCDHEVTQAEYETYCAYGYASPDSTNGKGDNYPVYYVSWCDAVVYCNLRSIAENLTPAYSIGTETDPLKWTGIESARTDGVTKYFGPSDGSIWNSIAFDTSADGYRLPTEAEWEYIARGGSEWKTYIYSGSDTIDDIAWYQDNSNSKKHEVKTKNANSLGIYDMSGNVMEWCYDWFGSISTDTSAIGAASGSFRVIRNGAFSSDVSSCTVSSRVSGDPALQSGDLVGFRVVRNAN